MGTYAFLVRLKNTRSYSGFVSHVEKKKYPMNVHGYITFKPGHSSVRPGVYAGIYGQSSDAARLSRSGYLAVPYSIKKEDAAFLK